MGYLKRHGGEKRSRFEMSWAVVVSGVLALIMFTHAVRSYIIERRELRNREASLEEIQKKEALRADLKEKLDKLQSGEGLEIEARSRLNLQRPDEHVLIVLDDKDKTASTTQKADASFWERLKGLFPW